MADSISDAQRLLGISVKFFESKCLRLNVDKCRSLIMGVVPSKKKVYCNPRPLFHVNAKSIPPITMEDVMITRRTPTTAQVDVDNRENLNIRYYGGEKKHASIDATSNAYIDIPPRYWREEIILRPNIYGLTSSPLVAYHTTLLISESAGLVMAELRAYRLSCTNVPQVIRRE